MLCQIKTFSNWQKTKTNIHQLFCKIPLLLHYNTDRVVFKKEKLSLMQVSYWVWISIGFSLKAFHYLLQCRRRINIIQQEVILSLVLTLQLSKVTVQYYCMFDRIISKAHQKRNFFIGRKPEVFTKFVCKPRCEIRTKQALVGG